MLFLLESRHLQKTLISPLDFSASQVLSFLFYDGCATFVLSFGNKLPWEDIGT